MKIKLIDQNFGDQPGLSMHIAPNHPFSRDVLNPDAVVFTDSMCYAGHDREYDCKKVAWIIEPPIINGEIHANMSKEENYSKFDHVCTYNRWLEDKIPNFKFVPHAGTWLRQQDIGIHGKPKLCSMIFSHKDWNASHRQRKRVFDMINDSSVDFVNFYGTGSPNPIDFKIDGLRDYMFSIAMENEAPPYLFSPNTDYFSEKLIDCLLAGCIPIFYGNPTVLNYFNPDGIIVVTDPDQVVPALEKLSPDLYLSKLDAVKENFEIARSYMNPEDIIYNLLNE
jgi:hypothetical protein